MKKIITSICLLSLFFIGCEKEELEGDTAFLIGKWKWEYTTYGFGSNVGAIEQSTTGQLYELEFSQEGSLIINYNGKHEKYRISSIEENFPTVFNIFLNKNDKYLILNPLMQDSIIVYNFPFPNNNNTKNYFLKYH